MKKSFLIVTIDGVRRVKPMDDSEIVDLVNKGKARKVNSRLYQAVEPIALPAGDAATSEYATKDMVAEPKRKRGRPAKVAQ